MIKGAEIDFVVKNSLKALELYKEIFDIEVVEVFRPEIAMITRFPSFQLH
ncbi:MAG: hypothetical protein GX306_09560 [Clostridiales bacterium]|nr:hypothetical protein [Clostridiales bacterium]